MTGAASHEPPFLPRFVAMPAARDPATPLIESGSQELVAVLVVDNDIVHARTMGECLSRLG